METVIRRAAIGVYAVLAYAMFVVAAVAAIVFLADVGGRNVVDGAARGPVWTAVTVDAALLALFALQHSAMARAGFKTRLLRVVPVAAERSTYVLAASLTLLLLFWQWRSLPDSLWRVDAQPWAALIWAIYGVGWVVTVTSTFMVDHLDFLGLRQAGWHARPGPYEPPSFTERWLYAWVRHPMMTGLIVVFWATPRMTVGHLLFATAGSLYIAVGLRFEERDLRRQLGETYREYAARVPAVVPRRPGEQRRRPSGRPLLPESSGDY